MSEREKLKYQFGFADLIGDCNKIYSFASRDVAEFSSWGIDQATLDAFKAEINEFEEFPMDEELLSAYQGYSDAKNKARQELEPMLTNLMTRAKLAFAVESSEFKQFRVKDIQGLRDDSFLFEARRLTRAAGEYLTELAVYGLTQAMIDAMDAKTTEYENALEAMADAAGKRTSSTTERIKKANALYDKMMRFSRVGKEIWRYSNESLWNDYLIYRSKHGRRKKRKIDDDDNG